MNEWHIKLKPFAAGFGAVPNKNRKGRKVYDGYLRGCGLQFGNLKELCLADPVYSQAYELATSPSPYGMPRTIVDPLHLMNMFAIMKLNLSSQKNPGHIVEFGSMCGGSAIFLAFAARELLPGTQVISFDSFEGMPETNLESDLHRKGEFQTVDIAELRAFSASNGLDNLGFIKGFFEDTLPEAMQIIDKVCLAHFDCDVYDSISFSYDQVKPRMTSGGYLVFDDPLIPTCIGAFEAVEEYLVRRDGLHAEQTFPQLVYRSP